MKQSYTFLLMIAVTLFLFSCKDKTPPKIYLEGDLEIDHVLNATYEEPGYTALDDEDGDITDKVTVTGPNVNAAGEQVINYSVKDAEGNEGTASRTLMVFNESDPFAGSWAGEFTQPYPGITKTPYQETITTSGATNNEITIANFANNEGANIVGTVALEGVPNAPVVLINDGQSIGGAALTVSSALITENNNLITIEYTLGTDGGVLVLRKQ